MKFNSNIYWIFVIIILVYLTKVTDAKGGRGGGRKSSYRAFAWLIGQAFTEDYETTTEKQYSFTTKMHMFMLKLIGEDVAEIAASVPKNTDEVTSTEPPQNMTGLPYVWMWKAIVVKDGILQTTLKPIRQEVIDGTIALEEERIRNGFTDKITFPDDWVKVYTLPTDTPLKSDEFTTNRYDEH